MYVILLGKKTLFRFENKLISISKFRGSPITRFAFAQLISNCYDPVLLLTSVITIHIYSVIIITSKVHKIVS